MKLRYLGLIVIFHSCISGDSTKIEMEATNLNSKTIWLDKEINSSKYLGKLRLESGSSETILLGQYIVSDSMLIFQEHYTMRKFPLLVFSTDRSIRKIEISNEMLAGDLSGTKRPQLQIRNFESNSIDKANYCYELSQKLNDSIVLKHSIYLTYQKGIGVVREARGYWIKDVKSEKSIFKCYWKSKSVNLKDYYITDFEYVKM